MHIHRSCMYIYRHTHVYVFIHVLYICKYINVCIYAHKMYLYTYNYICTYIRMYVCLYLYVVRMYVCIRRKHTHLSGDDGGVRVMVLRAMSVESLLLAEALELTFVDATGVVDVLPEPVGASSEPA